MKNINDIKWHRTKIKSLYTILFTGKKYPFWVRFHDMDKIIMIKLGVPYFIIRFLHRKLSFHHDRNIFNIYNYIEIILDLESTKYLKTNKSLNIIDAATLHYPKLINKIIPIVNKLGINDIKII